MRLDCKTPDRSHNDDRRQKNTAVEIKKTVPNRADDSSAAESRAEPGFQTAADQAMRDDVELTAAELTAAILTPPRPVEHATPEQHSCLPFQFAVID
jgi:hypothetical protein